MLNLSFPRPALGDHTQTLVSLLRDYFSHESPFWPRHRDQGLGSLLESVGATGQCWGSHALGLWRFAGGGGSIGGGDDSGSRRGSAEVIWSEDQVITGLDSTLIRHRVSFALVYPYKSRVAKPEELQRPRGIQVKKTKISYESHARQEYSVHMNNPDLVD